LQGTGLVLQVHPHLQLIFVLYANPDVAR
jgi:hypothetical protein